MIASLGLDVRVSITNTGGCACIKVSLKIRFLDHNCCKRSPCASIQNNTVVYRDEKRAVAKTETTYSDSLPKNFFTLSKVKTNSLEGEGVTAEDIDSTTYGLQVTGRL